MTRKPESCSSLAFILYSLGILLSFACGNYITAFSEIQAFRRYLILVGPFPGYGVLYPLRDVRGVVADPLIILGDHEQI